MADGFEYRVATIAEVTEMRDKQVAESGNDPDLVLWRTEFIEGNQHNRMRTYVILCNGVRIGSGTMLLSPECRAVGGRLGLADGKTTMNVNSLGVDKAYRGQGHMSRLVRQMEDDARAAGFTTGTIGVEITNGKNLGIYLHWGYDRYVTREDSESGFIVYFAKTLG